MVVSVCWGFRSLWSCICLRCLSMFRKGMRRTRRRIRHLGQQSGTFRISLYRLESSAESILDFSPISCWISSWLLLHSSPSPKTFDSNAVVFFCCRPAVNLPVSLKNDPAGQDDAPAISKLTFHPVSRVCISSKRRSLCKLWMIVSVAFKPPARDF